MSSSAQTALLSSVVHVSMTSFSTLDVEIRPGCGLGMFELGSSLWAILDMLRSFQHIFPQVDIKIDPDAATTTPILVHLKPHIDLLFSGKHQRLRTISLRKFRDPNPPVILRYKDSILSSTDEVLRRVGVSRTFGPTYPGEDLRYPGLWFNFEDEGTSDARGNAQSEDRIQEVKKIIILQKEIDSENSDALAEVLECPIMEGDVSRAVVKVHDGITLFFHSSPAKSFDIFLGKTTAQDLMLCLGAPDRIHYKEDDRMTIHSTKDNDEIVQIGYFYNYFRHGMDFLISGSTHVLQKIVLHTNVPGSPLFQRYKRCCWEIEGKPEDDEDDTPPRKRFYDKFETINHFLSPKEPPPSMVLDRTNDEDSIQLPNATTRLYGYDGIILEVSEPSNVVSVTLF